MTVRVSARVRVRVRDQRQGQRNAHSIHADEELFGRGLVHFRETVLELLEVQQPIAILTTHTHTERERES